MTFERSEVIHFFLIIIIHLNTLQILSNTQCAELIYANLLMLNYMSPVYFKYAGSKPFWLF